MTVCPPRGTNTALNHLLNKVKDVNFTDEERKQLLEISKEVFIEIPNKIYSKQIRHLLGVDNMKSVAYGHASMPEIDKDGTIILKTSEPEGSFQTMDVNSRVSTQ